MVLRRWAIKIVICSLALDIDLMVLVISSSVKESSAEVASSNINKLGLRSNALAMEMRCFSPPDNLSPPSPIIVSRPLSALATRLVQLAFSSTSARSASVATGFTNNRFSLIVPLKRLVSCVTKPIWLRRSSKFISVSSSPLYSIFPSCGR